MSKNLNGLMVKEGGLTCAPQQDSGPTLSEHGSWGPTLGHVGGSSQVTAWWILTKDPLRTILAPGSFSL